ncbi:hypothetical protein [Spongiactinospora sp. 9N601]|uniref:hypothetical protein n=1 Tax=Spongiactinospora sp. 9N601 TaxID=3375149 RepID=UPI003788A6C8
MKGKAKPIAAWRCSRCRPARRCGRAPLRCGAAAGLVLEQLTTLLTAARHRHHATANSAAKTTNIPPVPASLISRGHSAPAVAISTVNL